MRFLRASMILSVNSRLLAILQELLIVNDLCDTCVVSICKITFFL